MLTTFKNITVSLKFFHFGIQISLKGYKQVSTKINEYHICQQGNISDCLLMSSSHVKDRRRGGVCIL